MGGVSRPFSLRPEVAPDLSVESDCDAEVHSTHMKSAICGLFLAITLSAQTPPPTSVRVPDEAAALKIAEPALIKTYGKRKIHDERPLTATLDKGIWTVSGTLWCTDRNGNRTREQGMCVGGTAVLKLRQGDGKILSVIHYK
jgi:NTF2 fold immunity protein